MRNTLCMSRKTQKPRVLRHRRRCLRLIDYSPRIVQRQITEVTEGHQAARAIVNDQLAMQLAPEVTSLACRSRSNLVAQDTRDDGETRTPPNRSPRPVFTFGYARFTNVYSAVPISFSHRTRPRSGIDCRARASSSIIPRQPFERGEWRNAPLFSPCESRRGFVARNCYFREPRQPSKCWNTQRECNSLKFSCFPARVSRGKFL